VAGSSTFLKVAIMPAMLIVIFSLIYVLRRKSQAAGKPQAAGASH